MAITPFEKVDAAAYALFDTASGSQVGSALDRSDLFEQLDLGIHKYPEQFTRVLVVAVDESGNRLGSWKASELLTLA
jgi:hypothetical protein